MSHAAKRRLEAVAEPVRVLGRGLRAHSGVRLTLRALREAAGRTQDEVATAAKIDQADVSRLEGKEELDDCQMSTLQRYIAAIGGRVDIIATFGDKRFTLTGVTKSPRDGKGAPANRPLQRTGRKAPRR